MEQPFDAMTLQAKRLKSESGESPVTPQPSDETQLSARLGEKPSHLWPESQNQPMRFISPQAYILMEHRRTPMGVTTGVIQVYLDLTVAKEALGKRTSTYHRTIQITRLDTEVRS